jgi:hypothetical protein
MIRLPDSLRAWRSPDFKDVLKNEVERLSAGQLPLQQALKTSSHALDGPFDAMVIGVADEPGVIRVKVGIFFSGIVAGCNCADDPTPVEAQNEYCELSLAIDKSTAETSVTLLPD